MLKGKDSDSNLSNGTDPNHSRREETKKSETEESCLVKEMTFTEEFESDSQSKSETHKSAGDHDPENIRGTRDEKELSDPVNILQFSQESNILVTETLEDDGQSIIPPSPDAFRCTPLVIPSTPTLDNDSTNPEGMCETDDVQGTKSNKQQRITFSQESLEQTPIPTRQLLAEHVKQLVSDMERDGAGSKRMHGLDSSFGSLSVKKRKEVLEDNAASHVSPFGGRPYEVLSRHEQTANTSPRTSLASTRARPAILFSSGNDTLSSWQKNESSTLYDLSLEASTPDNKEDDDDPASWSLRLTASESTQFSPSEEQATHIDDSAIVEGEDDRLGKLEQLKVFRCLRPKPSGIKLKQRSIINTSDSDDQIRTFRSVKGRRLPVVDSQSSQESVPGYSRSSTPILSSTSSAAKRVHSEDEAARFTRPKMCNTSVQTDEDSCLTDHDTPNTSRESVPPKPKYHYRIKEELITYLLTCNEDGTVVKSVVLQTKTNVHVVGDEHKSNLMSSLSSSTSGSLLTSLTSGEMGDISSLPSSKSTSTSSLHSLKQMGLMPEHSSLEHSRESDKSSNTSMEKLTPSTCVRRTKSDASSSSESSALHDEHFTRPLRPLSAKRTYGRKLSISPAVPLPGTSFLKDDRSLLKSETPTRSSPRLSRSSLNKEITSAADATENVSRGAERTSPELSLGNLNESSEGQLSTDLFTGLNVMAKWVDNYFYFGKITKKEDSSSASVCKRWLVLFHDGYTRTLVEVDIFPVSIIQEGQSVFAFLSKSHSALKVLEPGVVTGLYHSDKEDGFIVDLDSGISRKCSYDQIALSIDQASCIRNVNSRSTSTCMSNISLENLVEGRRRCTAAATTPKKNRKPDPNLETTASSDESNADGQKTPTSLSGREKLRRTGKTEGSSPVNLPKVQLTPTRSSPRKAAVLAVAKLSSTIFKDFAFLLSCTEPKSQDRKKTLNESDSSFEHAERKVDENVTQPMDKKDLQEILEAGGGEVLDSFESTWPVVEKKVVLIANTYLRTIKYIQCLAAGIPCVSSTWVVNCCSQNKCLDLFRYRLPSGYSITKRRLIDWHGCHTILKDLHILLVSENSPEFVATWKPVLLAAQAMAVQQLTSSDEKEKQVLFDMVVTDSSCPERILNLSSSLHVPVVSTEWVVQCLINGYRLRPTAHPKFRFDYKE